MNRDFRAVPRRHFQRIRAGVRGADGVKVVGDAGRGAGEANADAAKATGEARRADAAVERVVAKRHGHPFENIRVGAETAGKAHVQHHAERAVAERGADGMRRSDAEALVAEAETRIRIEPPHRDFARGACVRQKHSPSVRAGRFRDSRSRDLRRNEPIPGCAIRRLRIDDGSNGVRHGTVGGVWGADGACDGGRGTACREVVLVDGLGGTECDAGRDCECRRSGETRYGLHGVLIIRPSHPVLNVRTNLEPCLFGRATSSWRRGPAGWSGAGWANSRCGA